MKAVEVEAQVEEVVEGQWREARCHSCCYCCWASLLELRKELSLQNLRSLPVVLAVASEVAQALQMH